MFLFYLLGNYLDSLPVIVARLHHPKVGDGSDYMVMGGAGLGAPQARTLTLQSALLLFASWSHYLLGGGFLHSAGTWHRLLGASRLQTMI